MRVVASVLMAVAFCVAISMSMPTGSFAAEPDFKAAAEEAARRSAQPSGRNADSADESRFDIVKRQAALDAKQRAWTQEFQQRTFEWHLLSTRIIFGLVIFIVGFGLFITYLQFRRDYTDSSYHQTHREVLEVKPADGDPAPIAVSVPSKSVTTMKLGPGGLELSSQIIGLAVLAFSLGFFYLYVKEVYPLNEVNVAKSAEKAKAQSEGGASK